MDALSRWIVKRERPVPNVLITLLAVYATFGAIGTGIFFVVEALDPRSTTRGLLLVLTVVLLLLNLPAILRARRRRGRVSLQPLLHANALGKLAEKLGANAATLEESAADLEQTQALLPWTHLDRDLQRELTRSTDARLLRMLELTVAAPARYGLTRSQANDRFVEDARWMAEVRRLVERIREAPERREDEGALNDLRELVEAREEARAELKA